MSPRRCILALLLPISLTANAWESFPDSKLVPTNFSDGDSFQVEIQRDGKREKQVIRLYFVDCPESTADGESDRRRVLEQMRYFGLESPDQVLDYATKASERTTQLLAKPFEVQTVFASALGRSRLSRIYARVITSTGEDLAAILVREGLARTYGIGRATPDGQSAADYEDVLTDLELSAIMARKGIWADSDPDRLVAARKAMRDEDRWLKDQFGANTKFPLDVNSATITELETVPGIGPVLAERIVAARPFDSLEELTTVQGISTTTITKFAEYLSAETTTNE